MAQKGRIHGWGTWSREVEGRGLMLTVPVTPHSQDREALVVVALRVFEKPGPERKRDLPKTAKWIFVSFNAFFVFKEHLITCQA